MGTTRTRTTPKTATRRKTTQAVEAPAPTPDVKQSTPRKEGPLRHAEGCPEVRKVDGEEVSAVESYKDTTPKGQPVTVTRCTMCGEASYRFGPPPDDEEA